MIFSPLSSLSPLSTLQLSSTFSGSRRELLIVSIN